MDPAFKDLISNLEYVQSEHCFVGINVKRSKDDKIVPFSHLFSTANCEPYNTEPDDILESGRIPNCKLPQEILFKINEEFNISKLCVWKNNNPKNINDEETQAVKGEINKLTKEEDNKKGIIRDIKTCCFNSDSEVWCWIYHVDPDIESLSESKQYLSFILAVATDEATLNGLRAAGNRDLLVEFVMRKKSEYVKSVEAKMQNESIKSAKAAIMARNMSHNLGSHVMFYIKQRLESVEKILQTGTLLDLVNSKSIDEIQNKLNEITTPGEITIDDNHKELPFLVGLGRFINYLQERQDYIATIATDYIPYNSVVNFKDSIYDELKPELRSKRHNGDAWGKKASNLLLDYIAYSEGFTSEKIVLEFPRDNETEYFNGEEDVPVKLRKFNVALPGGTLGRQAFFSIMENIIRNTSKHDGSKVRDGKLVFRFDVLDKVDANSNSFYYSGENKYNKDEVSSAFTNHVDDYFYLGITVADIDASETVKKIGKSLNRDYIKDGQMDDECKGIKEIRLSAAWMRGYGLDTEIPMGEPPAVSVRCDENMNLQYIICLPKPKKVAFVVETKEGLEKVEELISNSCNVFVYNKMISDSDEKDFKLLSNYELIIIEDNQNINADNIIRKVSSRVFTASLNDIREMINKCASGDYQLAYEKWLIVNGWKDAKISIFDEQAQRNTNNNDSLNNIKIGGSGMSGDEYYRNCIVFTTHYVGQALLTSAADKQLYAQARYVESVSGGNSTDRLIRHDNKDYEWFAKHVAAGYTKVAIFDERIYSSIMPKGKIIEAPEEIEKDLKAFFEKHNPDDVFALNDFLENKYEISDTDVVISFMTDFGWGQNVGKWVEGIQKHKGNPTGRDFSTAWKYLEKGIWVFNIRIVEAEKTVEIIGYNAPVTSDLIGQYSEDYTEAKLGTIKWDDKNGIKIEMNKDFKQFDFITIHQGLLDKIYGVWHDKIEQEKQKSVIYKLQITRELFEKFSKKKEILKTEDTISDVFLPQFIIHSGRSKPNAEDMPQKQPFIQFAALDHAVKDCKLTLTELLYSAHYE